MVRIIRQGVYYMENRLIKESQAFMTSDKKEAATANTVTRRILDAHNQGTGETLKLKPDAVFIYDPRDILRTADFIGLEEFPLPVHLLEGFSDGAFCRSAAEKWGGVSLPGNLACAGAYACERVACGGQLLFNNDGISCGALGAVSLWVDEGDILRCFTQAGLEETRRPVLAVFLKGKPRRGVGPTDVALAVMQAFEKAGGFAGDKYLEVFGAGLSNLSMDFRNALDSALDCGQFSVVWATDEKTKEYFETHGRGQAYKQLAPVQPAYYDGAAVVDLSEIEPMAGFGETILTVREFLETAPAEYRKNGKVFLGGASVEYTCATYETMSEMAEILRGKQLGSETACSWLPYSKSVTEALAANGSLGALLSAGVDFNDLLIGTEGLLAQDAGFAADAETAVRLDARTIAASLACGGYLTSALGCEYARRFKKYQFDPAPYESRVLDRLRKPRKTLPLAYGEISPLSQLPPLPDSAALHVNGDEGSLAFTLGEDEEYGWSQAIDDREHGVLAILAEDFSERLREHLIDWGILPLVYRKFTFKEGDVLHLENLTALVKAGEERIVAKVVGKRRTKDIVLSLGTLTKQQREILLAGGKNNVIKGE